jgi:putative heme transporter
VLTASAIYAVFRNAGQALTQVALGVILALALDPLVVSAATRLHVTRTKAVAIVAAVFATATVLLVLFVGPPATRQAAQFGKQLPATIQKFEDLPLVGPPLRHYDLQKNVDRWTADLPAKLDAESLQDGAARLLSNVMSFLVVGAVVIGALLDGPRLLALVRSMFVRRPDLLERVDRVGRVTSMTLGQYFGGSLTVASMMGLFVLIVGLALQVPLAPLAALWAMLTDLIPQVGGFLGGTFFVMLALTKGPVTALVAAGLFVVYMNIENHLISPAVVGESVDLSPATTMLAAFIGGAIAGLPGSLVATPLVGAAKRLYLESRTGRPTKVASKQPLMKRVVGVLRKRQRH